MDDWLKNWLFVLLDKCTFLLEKVDVNVRFIELRIRKF